MGYYDQEQTTLNDKKSVLDEVWDDHPLLSEQSVRTLLGSFLFSGEDVDKSIFSLSGGEKARVALAKLALEKNNTLLLDEPTNHLDIDSKEVLENALIDFEGTLLFVSHDRYFINRLATKVIELSEDGATLYLGDYDYYLQKKAELEAIESIDSSSDLTDTTGSHSLDSTSDQTAKLSFEAQKERQKKERKLTREIERIEKELEDLEAALLNIQHELSQPETFSDSAKTERLSKENDTLSSKQENLLIEWETLHDTLENL
jgi:ATP-binding cassette subfamily F protein 3